uniref:hypothetical protein n=1 Tax=Roseobacter litoralis TaxID=42443 RepID=UPI00249526AA
LVVLLMFQRLPRHEALIWSVLMGYLFLPTHTGIDLPLLPELNKTLIPGLTAGLMCLMLPDAGNAKSGRRHRTKSENDSPPEPLPQQSSLIANTCLIILFLVPIGVFWTNQEALVYGPRRIPGIRLYDIFSMMLSAGVMLLPFLLARCYLTTPAARATLLRALVIGGLIYSVLILVEVRLSPQLNKWIYGFYSHSFGQHIRAGGFRPMVFLEHGLRVGIFIAMTCLAAVALWRMKATTDDESISEPPEGTMTGHRPIVTKKPPYLLYAGYLFIILFLSKTLGAFLIAFVLLPVAIFFGARLQLIAAACIAAAVLTYPMLRTSDIFPMDRLIETLTSLNAERASSFVFRVGHEDALLDRAKLKPIFGWGGWARGHIFDPETGRYLSVTDGVWVIVFGEKGWLGYLATFGLLTLPVIGLALRRRNVGMVGSGLCLLLGANLVDLLPNSALTPITWLVAGTVLALYENPARAPAPDNPTRGTAPDPVKPRARAGPIRTASTPRHPPAP